VRLEKAKKHLTILTIVTLFFTVVPLIPLGVLSFLVWDVYPLRWYAVCFWGILRVSVAMGVIMAFIDYLEEVE